MHRLHFSRKLAANAGGAIDNSGGSLQLIRPTFIGNTAPVGGAIDNYAGTLQLIRPTFSGNKASKATHGPDCYCFSPKLCVGCTCAVTKGTGSTYCPFSAGGIVPLTGTHSYTTAAQLIAALPRAIAGAKLLLICTAAKRCTISGVQLIVPKNIEVKMAYVDMKDHTTSGVGGLMEIHGSVTGTGLAFSGGKTTANGGAVYIDTGGSFACTDCAFRDNSATADNSNGGAIMNWQGGSLQLIRPTFSGNKARWSANCYGSGCP